MWYLLEQDKNQIEILAKCEYMYPLRKYCLELNEDKRIYKLFKRKSLSLLTYTCKGRFFLIGKREVLENQYGELDFNRKEIHICFPSAKGQRKVYYVVNKEKIIGVYARAKEAKFAYARSIGDNRKRPRYEYLTPSIAQYVPQKCNENKICWIGTKKELIKADFHYDYDEALNAVKRWKINDK